MLRCFILCGGSGTRLWPLSTKKNPKQFVKILGDETLLQMTFKRVKYLCGNIGEMESEIVLVTHENFTHLIKEQLKDEKYKILEEKHKKDTGAAITLSSMLASKEDILLFIPSDRYIPDVETFTNTVKKSFSNRNKITVFGIVPEYPETEYGYIRMENGRFSKFVEKPNKNIAEYFVNSGEYFWNSGIFLFSKKIFKQEMKKYNIDYWNSCKKSVDKKRYKLTDEVVNLLPISIDYLLMEKSTEIECIKGDFKWSDLGTWKSIKKEKGGDEIMCDGENVFAMSKKQVVCVGLNNIAIVETDNYLLVMDMDKSSKLKDFVNLLESKNF